MSHRSHEKRVAPSARRVSGSLIALCAFAIAACDDGPGEPEDIDVDDIVGTWVAQEPYGTFYLEITPTTITSFGAQTDVCYASTTFDIDEIDGREITLSSESGVIRARFRLDGATLVVDGQEFMQSDTDVSTLDVCDDPSEAVCAEQTLLAPPDTVAGALAVGDFEENGGFLYDLYSIQPSDSVDVTIGLQSAAFDAFLVVLDAEGTPVAADDDDGANGADALLTVSLEAGCYTIVATSFEPRVTGSYQVTLE